MEMGVGFHRCIFLWEYPFIIFHPNKLLEFSVNNTRMVCVKVRTRPICDGLDAVLRGLLTCEMDFMVLVGNFQNELIVAWTT